MNQTMELVALRDYMLSKPGAVEERPFGPDALVYKVGGKMFALIAHREEPLRLNLKALPDKGEELRSLFRSIIPGYHMNKRHWNTLILDGELGAGLVEDLIDESYSLVFGKLPRHLRVGIEDGVS